MVSSKRLLTDVGKSMILSNDIVVLQSYGMHNNQLFDPKEIGIVEQLCNNCTMGFNLL